MKKYLFLVCLSVMFLAGLLLYQFIIFNDGKLHVVFCDVGQGDAILIKTPEGEYILYDAGPDKSVLDCLSRHMPVWHRDIDLAFLSHPHTDHFLGYYYLLERFHIKAFATEQLDNKTPGFQILQNVLKEKHVPISYVLRGDRFKLSDGVLLAMEGPSQEYLDKTSPGGRIGETKEFASVIIKLTYGNFTTLLTGDSQAAGLEEAFKGIGGKVTVMQTPHHGSATGLNFELIQKLAPKIAVISVGKNNYGHPTLATLQLLTVPNIILKRTDKDGDVEIVSDGSNWHTTR